MKKIILLLLLVFLCGCSFNENPYKDFEHYDLTDYHYKEFSYLRDDSGPWYDLKPEYYALSLLIRKGEDKNILGYTEGLLYKVDENDYILLDSYASDDQSYELEYYTYFYKDKLYILRDLYFCEYTLNKENTTKNKITFDYTSIQEKYHKEDLGYVSGRKIEKVDDKYIYFSGVSMSHIEDTHFNLKCSLENYKCEEYDEKAKLQ